MNENLKAKKCCLTCKHIQGRFNHTCSKRTIELDITDANCCPIYEPILDICGTCEHSKLNNFFGTLQCFDPQQNTSCYGRTVPYHKRWCENRYSLSIYLPKDKNMTENSYMWQLLKDNVVQSTIPGATETQVREIIRESSLRDNRTWVAIAMRPCLTISTKVTQNVEFIRETISYGKE